MIDHTFSAKRLKVDLKYGITLPLRYANVVEIILDDVEILDSLLNLNARV